MESTFTEVTVVWNDAEIMVHLPPDCGKILRAYTFERDKGYLSPDWIGEKSSNPVFRHLTAKACASRGLLRRAIAELKRYQKYDAI